MNQLALSTDLTVITAEINSYKQVAGQAVFEIGKRLKHVKDNDLAHGQFITWLESVEIGHTTAKRMMQAYDQFGNSATSHHLDSSKIFEMLSLPESVDRTEFIEKEHIIPSTGESKTVDKMTVKETREVTKAVKEAEQRAAQAEASQAKALAEHTQQQEALLAQIEQLKLVKDSPETLQRIAELEEQVGREHHLAMDNIKLKLDMKSMEQAFNEKITRRDEEIHAMRGLNSAFRNIIATLTTEHANAKMLYRSLVAHKSAHEAMQDFIKHFDPLVQSIFKTWREASMLIAEEVSTENERRTDSEGSGTNGGDDHQLEIRS